MAVQLNLFDLNLLRALDVLLDEQSVTRAAERLHVTQQAMSGSLKRLREHFGDDLFVRVGPRLEPTPLGVALRGPVRQAMLQIALTVETVPHFVPANARRQFRVALSDYAVASFAPMLMARVLREAPGISFELHDVTMTAFADLEMGDLDLTVQPSFLRFRPGGVPAGLRSAPLYDDDFACAVDGSVHGWGELTVDRYMVLPHAATRLSGSDQVALSDAWARIGLAPHVAVTTTSFASALFLLPGTPMVATVQRSLIRKLAQVLPIREFDCPIPTEPLHLELFWHARNENDPGHRWVREQFQAAGLVMDPATS